MKFVLLALMAFGFGNQAFAIDANTCGSNLFNPTQADASVESITPDGAKLRVKVDFGWPDGDCEYIITTNSDCSVVYDYVRYLSGNGPAADRCTSHGPR